MKILEGNYVYMRSLQETITKHFSNIDISVSDEMDIGLFQILQASNAPLMFFVELLVGSGSMNVT